MSLSNENRDILTSDSDEEILSSESKEDLTIAESSDSEDSFVPKSTKKKIFQNRAIISSSEEEEEEFERRVLSPRTRMSITGVRPSDLTDSSSEIEYTDDEGEDSNNETKNSISKPFGIETSAQEDNRTTSDHSNNDEVVESSTDEEKENSESDSYHSVNKETPERKSFQGRKTNESKIEQQKMAAERYSSVFEQSIMDKLSSTQTAESVEQVISSDEHNSTDLTKQNSIQSDKTTQLEKSSDASDVIEITKKNSIVDISSDDEDDVVPVLTTKVKSIQPKIGAALMSHPSTSQSSVGRKIVSAEFYEKEIKKLEELRSDLTSAVGLYEKLGPSLFDGGKQLSLRVQTLKNNVRDQASLVASYVLEDNKPADINPQKTEPFGIKTLDWDDLSAAVNQVKPIHTGKQGLSTFNQQKVLTIDRLKDLHGSLATCPGEDVLADDPIGLKVSLMAHQKHALAWMNWREGQKPRGGILADDMGLGKTLTMIAMVLAFKNRQDEREESSEESEEENDNQGWSSKNRKDFYNGGTLVVCPASLMRQWESEVESKVNRHKLSVCIHHGNNRDTKPRHLKTYDIVITTYNIATRESKTHGALYSIKWNRVILDEAHVVRNPKSQSSIAVCELRAKYRWALTGTPIQNKEMDVYALLKFLKCTPFDDLNHWKKWIDNKSAGGQQRLNTLMKSLMLRRTKAQLQEQGSLMCLPTRDCTLIDVNLDKDEMNVYQKIMTYSKTLFAQFLHQRAEKNNDLYYQDQGYRPTFMQTKDPNGAFHKMHQKFSKLHHGGKEVKSHEILVLLLRLRQICCHPGLIDAMLEDEDENLISTSTTSDPDIDLLDQLNKLAINDNSESDSQRMEDLLNESQNEAMSKASARVLQRSNPVFDLSRPSSKMKIVLQVVEEKIVNTQDKCIIISQWTSILNILKKHLEDKNIKTLSLNGSIPVKNRQSIVSEFNDPNTRVKILLLSLTAGGVGLNLVGANHLMLIDLHWNPQLESQAQDRIYRVGQKKPVHIYKFMCKETVEERIKALQDHKLQLANGLLTGVKASEGSKLSIDDLKGLFGL